MTTTPTQKPAKAPAAQQSPAVIVEPPAAGRALEVDAGRVRGRIDAIDGGMIFGWAFDESHPEDRLEVRILHAGQEIGRVTADRPRADLKRLGVGQGTHAFACALPEGLDTDISGLTAIAISARGGAETVLDRPLRLDIANDAVADQLRRIADLLETALLRQDDMRTLQQSMVGALRTIHAVQRRQDRPDDAEDEEGAETRAAVEHALAVVEEGQQALSERLNQLDVFQLRFDQTLSVFEQRLKALTSSADQPLRRAVAALAVFTGLIAGVAIYAVAMPRI
jgi:hypothetical protein